MGQPIQINGEEQSAKNDCNKPMFSLIGAKTCNDVCRLGVFLNLMLKDCC